MDGARATGLTASLSPPGEHRVSELRAVSPSYGGRKCRLWTARSQKAGGRGCIARARSAGKSEDGGVREIEAVENQRRAAAAGRAGAGAGEASAAASSR